MEGFRLGDILVDIKRCEIHRDGQILNIEPRVMEVLAFLCVHRGEVISQQRLHVALWPGTTFSSSSIQRCIAILRKALGENASNPRIILTHPKRGYSLGILPQSLANSQDSTNNSRSPVPLLTGLLVLALALVLSIVLWSETPKEAPVRVAGLSPLTSSGLEEYLPALSHQGDILAFIRSGASGPQLVLKNLVSEQERLLAVEVAEISSLSWTLDDKGLTLVRQRTPSDGYAAEIVNLNIDSGEITPVISIQGRLIDKPEWLSATQLVVLSQSPGGQYCISRYAIDGVSQCLWRLNYEPLLMRVSADLKTLAVASFEQENRYRLDLYGFGSDEGQLLTRLDNGVHGLVWRPDAKGLVLSSRENLFALSLKGQINQIELANYKQIRLAGYSLPRNALILNLGSVDIDIEEAVLAPSAPENTAKTIASAPVTLVNSDALDILPRYLTERTKDKPADLVFQTHRHGRAQLFLIKDGSELPLFLNPNSEEFFGFAASPDARQVALATQSQLYIFDTQTLALVSQTVLPHRMYIRDWYRNEEALLVKAAKGDVPRVGKWHLARGTVEYLSAEAASCPALDEQDQVFYAKGRQLFSLGVAPPLWSSPAGEVQNIVVAGNNLIVETETPDGNQLWQLTLPDARIQPLALDGVSSISDVSPDGHHLLQHSPIRSRRELALLSISDMLR